MTVRLSRGATTITLSGDGATIAACTYTPRSPDLNEQEIRSALNSGGDVAALARANVTESCSVILTGTAANMLAQARGIEAIFPIEDADRMADPLYVEFDVQNGTLYRSEILSGRLEWPETPQGKLLASGAVEVLLVWKRRYFWEGPEAEATNGGVSIYNHSIHPGTTTTNKVAIAGNRVTGVIPAACRIEITNTSGGTMQYGEVYIGHNAFATGLVDNLHIIQAESTSGGVQSDITCSGGQRKDVTVDGTWGLKATWQAVSQLGGRRYAVLLRAPIAPLSTYVKMQVRDWQGLSVLAEGPEVLLSKVLQQVAVFDLPPALRNVSGIDDVTIGLLARSAAGGTLQLDYLQLTPTDSYRKLTTIRQNTYYSINNNDKIVDDGMARVSYLEVYKNSIWVKQPLLAGQGELLLWPGMNQTLYVLFAMMNTESPIDKTSSVRVWYRPRRLTL